MIKIFTAGLVLTAALVGCAGTVSLKGAGDPDIERAIIVSTQGAPGKADTLRSLQNAGIVKTPADVSKVAMILDMSCPFIDFPGATPFSPERMQEQLAQSWHIDVTTEQATRFQSAQKSYCA